MMYDHKLGIRTDLFNVRSRALVKLQKKIKFLKIFLLHDFKYKNNRKFLEKKVLLLFYDNFKFLLF